MSGIAFPSTLCNVKLYLWDLDSFQTSLSVELPHATMPRTLHGSHHRFHAYETRHTFLKVFKDTVNEVKAKYSAGVDEKAFGTNRRN